MMTFMLFFETDEKTLAAIPLIPLIPEPTTATTATSSLTLTFFYNFVE